MMIYQILLRMQGIIIKTIKLLAILFEQRGDDEDQDGEVRESLWEIQTLNNEEQ